MEEILTVLIVLLIGVFMGWYLREWHAMHKVHQMLAAHELEQEIEEEENPNRIPIRFDRHEDMWFVYNANDNSFMANATSFEALEEMLMERFPNKTFAITEENAAEHGIELS